MTEVKGFVLGQVDVVEIFFNGDVRWMDSGIHVVGGSSAPGYQIGGVFIPKAFLGARHSEKQFGLPKDSILVRQNDEGVLIRRNQSEVFVPMSAIDRIHIKTNLSV